MDAVSGFGVWVKGDGACGRDDEEDVARGKEDHADVSLEREFP